MVEQGGELHLLVFLRGFPHTRQPLGHACPARCRVRVRRWDVLLDQRPSLPILRRECSLVVRMSHRYYAAVRLLEDVHTGRTALAFTRRPARLRRHPRGLPVLVQEVSRRAWGLRLRRTVPRARAIAQGHVAFRYSDSVGVLIARFRSSIPSPPIPLFTLRCYTSRCPTQNSGPSGSLLLSREDLSSSASCRFIPAQPEFCLLNSAALHPGRL